MSDKMIDKFEDAMLGHLSVSYDAVDGRREAAKECYELAKEMATGFGGWIQENGYLYSFGEINKWYKAYTIRKDFPAGFSMATTTYEYFTIEQLFELYLKSKEI